MVVLTVGDNIGHCFQGSVSTSKWKWVLLQMKNSNKIGEISHKKKQGMVLTVGDDVGQCFQGTVHSSKHGKCGYAR